MEHAGVKPLQKCCDLCDNGSPLYIHARCHINAATYGVQDGATLVIYCSACDKKVCGLELASKEQINLIPKCCNSMDFFAVYHGDPAQPPVRMTLECAGCKTLIAEFQVMGYAK
jgi:hypothetical protein